MELIPDSILLHQYSPSHYIVKCTIANLLAAPIANWQHNRPPDISRAAQIAQHIIDKRLYPDWLIVVSCNTVMKKIAVLDGIHRISALKIIFQKPVDLMGPDISWLMQSHVLLCIHSDITEGQEIDLFKQINNCMPVPDIYYRNDSQIKRETIEAVATIWINKYKSHFSSSVKPNIPNTNRDLFIGILDTIYEKYKDTIDGQTETLLELCEKANNLVKTRLETGHILIKSQSALEKCALTGCYLFIVAKYNIELFI